MAHFIMLTHGVYGQIRINVDHILAYHPDTEEEEDGGPVQTCLLMSDGAPIKVKEYATQIDHMIDPTRTP